MALPLESIITRRCIFTGRTMGDIHRGVVVPFMLRRGYLVRTHDASTQQFPRKIIRDMRQIFTSTLGWDLHDVDLAAMGCEASKDRDPNVKHGNDTTDRFRVRVEHWTEEQYEGSSLPGKRYGALGQ